MPNPDEWCREIDDLLFGTGAADSRERPAEEVGDRPVGDGEVSIDSVDTALFGRTERSSSTAKEAHEHLAASDITAPAEAEFVLPEPEMQTTPARSTGDERGRRRRWVVSVFIALTVAIGTGLGAMAVTRSDGPKPAVRTGSHGTTTTTAPTTTAPTTTAPTTTAPPTTTPPETSARAQSPSLSSSPPPAPTTTPRSTRAPRPLPTEPAPPDPAPPPAPPDETTTPTSTPDSTLPIPPAT